MNTYASAVFSPCRAYRYSLERVLPQDGPTFLLLGVNPSDADERTNDHTITKACEFVRRWGGGRLWMANPFARVSKDVRALSAAADPIGPDNDFHLARMMALADVIVPCWGRVTKVPRQWRYRFAQVAMKAGETGKPVQCFRLTKGGDPMHPLMLAYSTPLVPYRWQRL